MFTLPGAQSELKARISVCSQATAEERGTAWCWSCLMFGEAIVWLPIVVEHKTSDLPERPVDGQRRGAVCDGGHRGGRNAVIVGCCHVDVQWALLGLRDAHVDV